MRVRGELAGQVLPERLEVTRAGDSGAVVDLYMCASEASSPVVIYWLAYHVVVSY